MPSKLQVIVDEISCANLNSDKTEAIGAILKAIKLLVDGQKQTMKDVEEVRFGYRGEIPIK